MGHGLPAAFMPPFVDALVEFWGEAGRVREGEWAARGTTTGVSAVPCGSAVPSSTARSDRCARTLVCKMH